jgi:hypothetical protein
MKRVQAKTILGVWIAAFAGTSMGDFALAGEPKWRQHTINANSEFEAAGAFDVDGDGKLDIVSGNTWYRAPDWEPVPIREVQRVGTYYNDFATLPLDVNGDGHLDFFTVSYFGSDVGWVENPGKPGETWNYHRIDSPGPSEAAVFVDLTGDGIPDLLPNPTNVVAWYEILPRRGTKGFEIKKHDFGTEAAGHGVGSGDVNGDGRIDLLTPKGWFEAPPDPAREPWTWHPEWNLGAAGIQILARDLDGDGLSEVVYGMGHDYGLFWLKQSRSEGGQRQWTKGVIDETIASVHTLLWSDLDGDGKPNELLTGKRVYAHEIEPGATEGSVIAWYQFDPAAGAWKKHVIFQGEPALNAPASAGERLALRDFPPGTAGTGLQMTVIDLDGDGDLDLICPGKSGLYLFENLGSDP